MYVLCQKFPAEKIADYYENKQRQAIFAILPQRRTDCETQTEPDSCNGRLSNVALARWKSVSVRRAT